MLSAEEAALMRSGIAELARLRRMGAKAAKHPPMEREVSRSRAVSVGESALLSL